jgi:hypothetical protein
VTGAPMPRNTTQEPSPCTSTSRNSSTRNILAWWFAWVFLRSLTLGVS